MGTEHYIVDREKRIAFDCHKWYPIGMVAHENGGQVPIGRLMEPGALDEKYGRWLRVALKRWMQWHGLESAELVRNVTWVPPDDWTDDWRKGETYAEYWARNGWELCSLWGVEATQMDERMSAGL